MNLDSYIESLKEDIVRTTQEWIKIKSVEGEPKPGMPFGEGVNQALLKALADSAKMGFTTKNVDGYAGYAEYGQGKELVGILVHLDVVPEGDGWSYDPYGGVIVNNRIYGRGTVDNKGPAVACLYALKAIKDLNLPVSKRVRIIYGLNEESGWACMDYYRANEEIPQLGFAPDAEFPIIYAEKGILTLKLAREFSNLKNGELVLKSFKGGLRANMVPDFAVAVLEGSEKALKTASDALENYKKEKGFKMEAVIEGNTLTIKSYGISAHGSLPEKGKNAIAQLLVFLTTLPLPGDDISAYLNFLAEKIGLTYNGENIGLKLSDNVSGNLTLNLGVLELTEKEAYAALNIRYPVTYKKEDLLKILEEQISGTGIYLKDISDMAPLYVPEDHFLVQKLKKVYEEKTGEPARLIAIGGGTYARAIPNAVAFGPLFPGMEELAHQKDEYIDIDHLIQITKIYAAAIYELIK
ncbi:dipeptidase PepV [Carboxydothermus hydrogenoformans]|uniref:Peptidase, M20/M25/M40 family n=1 Tax=Carboxydothermus hydrogenoformans (strain ATCC BAA-161 / DSM 6008 / Z-2901) TaxID=246194 RepID=Q3AA05_CARHZ|nr:dipeptidase PepV [Carboxydothermus hydrogenoformans]ABB15007.1 peptidase, M20/M25/M40 family [Carboxydothermus hydrogenoformans Z-2901]